jgi:hypothetical protein
LVYLKKDKIMHCVGVVLLSVCEGGNWFLVEEKRDFRSGWIPDKNTRE